MTKKELVKQVSEENDIPAYLSQRYVDSIFKIISDQLLAGNKVLIQGFGTFQVAHYKERPGRNPSTGELITLKPHKAIYFKHGKTLKRRLNS